MDEYSNKSSDPYYKRHEQPVPPNWQSFIANQIRHHVETVTYFSGEKRDSLSPIKRHRYIWYTTSRQPVRFFFVYSMKSSFIYV